MARPVDAAPERSQLEAAAIEGGLAPVRLPDGLRLRRRGDMLFAVNYDDADRELSVPTARWLFGSERSRARREHRAVPG